MKDKRSNTSATNGKLGGRPKELQDFKAIDEENWRPIKGFDQYFISDHGRVISIKKGKPSILKGNINYKNKHKSVALIKSRDRHYRYVHRLVLEEFVGKCKKGLEASHLDGDPLNNHLWNLRWESHKDNCHRQKEHGTMKYGEAHPQSKLSNAEVRGVRFLLSTNKFTQKEIAVMFGVCRQTISCIKTGSRRSKC